MDEERGGDALAAGGTAGPATTYQPATGEDRRRLEELQRRSGGRLLLRLDDTDDVSGHMALGDLTLVRVVVQDDQLDSAGHAISLRLPSVDEADAFRRRLLLTGVLVGTVALAGAGAALAVSQDADAAPDPAASQVENVSYEDATPNSGTV